MVTTVGAECLSEEELLDLASGGALADRASHIHSCVSCGQAVALVLSGQVGESALPWSPEQAVFSPGDFCDRFEIVAVLGQGGMGTVYRAHDPALGRDVALKVTSLPSAFVAHEAKAMAAVRSPYVIAVFEVVTRRYVHLRGDSSRTAGSGYLVMEWVEGTSLAQAEVHALSSEAKRALLFDVARALEAVHAAGIVHGDVKPANILLLPAGSEARAKLGDFGLAQRVDGAPAHGGTRGYMAPEVAAGNAPTVRSDVYSFACLVHALHTEQAASREAPIGSDASVRLPNPLRPLVDAALSRLPEGRPASMAAFLPLLAPKRPTRRPALAWAFVAAIAVALGFVLLVPPRSGLSLRPLSALPKASVESTHLVDVTVENNRKESIVLDWVDFDGRRVRYQTIAPGVSAHQESYAGHVWAVGAEKASGQIDDLGGFVSPSSPNTLHVGGGSNRLLHLFRFLRRAGRNVADKLAPKQRPSNGGLEGP